MAVLSVHTTSRAGVNLSDNDAAASGGGDSFPNTGRELLYALNASGGDHTITMAFAVTLDGQTAPNRTVVVPAGKAMVIGPFPMSQYNDANGRVALTYSAVTSLTVLVFRNGE